MKKAKRYIPIQFYVSEEEQFLLEEKMKLIGAKNLSAFLRQLIRYGFVYEVDYAPLREMNGQLGRISSSMNQVAKRVNQTSHVYSEDLAEIKEMMNKIWRLQTSIQSQQPFIKR